MKKLRDPVSSITHMIGAIAAIPGLVFLILYALKYGTTVHLVSYIVFGISLILLYTASATYHGVNVKDSIIKVFRKIDHMMIFVLIAGTYTPICLVALKGTLGYALLITIWALAIIGIVLKALWMNMPRWVCSVIYIAMGWFALVAIVQLVSNLSTVALILLLAGGLCYTIGGIIYGTKFTFINFKHFGFHELFHIFVMFGSALHYFMVIKLIK